MPIWPLVVHYPKFWHPWKFCKKKAIRHVALEKYNAHTGPIFKKLELLTLADTNDMARATFVHKLINGNLPRAFTGYFQYLEQIGDSRNRADDGKIFIPFSKNPKIHSPKWEAIKLWNSLPRWLRTIGSEREFRAELKKTMLEKYESECCLEFCKSCGRYQTKRIIRPAELNQKLYLLISLMRLFNLIV